MKEEKYDAIIVGSGLAGLSAALELSRKNKNILLLESNAYAGGRTSSFVQNGMKVESGLHRHIGYYSKLPKLLKKCGVNINNIVTWEEKADILIKNKNKKIVVGLSPFFGPIKTIRGITENRDSLSVKDKISLIPFFICGFFNYIFSDKLDNYSLSEYANKHKVTDKAQRLILEPLSSGIFFLPPENYSAYAFFGLFAPAIPKFYKMRIGAYLGGMTEIICNPIINKIKELGGDVIFNQKVSSVILRNGNIIGVKCADGKNYYAENTIIATNLSAAKEILAPMKNTKKLKNMFRLPTMSACSLQIELKYPALKKDITTFAPGTNIVSLAEQSRSTFQCSKGRLSLILGNPKEFAEKSKDEILSVILPQLKSVGINIENSIIRAEKVSENNDFYSLGKGSQSLRPTQYTGIKGLILAGDYTLTPSFATMEGAVISGEKAAKICIKISSKAVYGKTHR